jgi:DNA-binding NtrC family response regulator
MFTPVKVSSLQSPPLERSIGTERLLVVSRDPAGLRPLWSMVQSNSWQLETAPSAWEALERVQSGVVPNLVILDAPHGDHDSLHVLRWLHRLCPELRVIVLCNRDDASFRKEAIKLGAEDTLVKPLDNEQLDFLIRRQPDAPSFSAEGEIASEDVERLGEDDFFLSGCPAMHKLREQTSLLAETDVPILIVGEAGSGKTSVARLIHKLSVRSEFKFLQVNSAALPPDLQEAELFGSAKEGSTGTARSFLGKLETDGRGTLFLHEITALPIGLQSRLLEVLRDKRFLRPGEGQAVDANVRLLAGTSADLERALASKSLRQDFYYRMSAFTIHVPPLRQRKEEIPVLLKYFMRRLARHYGLPSREFTRPVLKNCQEYFWPGNLKELEAFTKRYLVAGSDDLGLNQSGNTEAMNVVPQVVGSGSANAEIRRLAHDPSSHEQKSLKSLIQSVKSETEKSAIAAALAKTGWNRKAAARLLKVSYRSLLYKIDQYHMSSSDRVISPLLAGMAKRNGEGE